MRTGDIPDLVRHFIEKKARDLKMRRMPALDPEALEGLQSYHWPGIVREKAPQGEDTGGAGGLEPPRALDEIITEHLQKTLAWTGGRIEGAKGAARILGLHLSTLRGRMRKLGIPHGRRAKRPGE